MTDLCPFCGMLCTTVTHRWDDSRMDWLGFRVECPFCDACGPLADSEEEAVRKWEERDMADRPLLCLDAHIVRWEAPYDFTLLIGGSEVAYTARSEEERDMLAGLLRDRKPLKIEIREEDSSP